VILGSTSFSRALRGAIDLRGHGAVPADSAACLSPTDQESLRTVAEKVRNTRIYFRDSKKSAGRRRLICRHAYLEGVAGTGMARRPPCPAARTSAFACSGSVAPELRSSAPLPWAAHTHSNIVGRRRWSFCLIRQLRVCYLSFQRSNIWREEGEDVAWWDPRVGKENRETAGANCCLGMKIFLLHPQ
jgi:hypothetical protein